MAFNTKKEFERLWKSMRPLELKIRVDKKTSLVTWEATYVPKEEAKFGEQQNLVDLRGKHGKQKPPKALSMAEKIKRAEEADLELDVPDLEEEEEG